MPTDPTPTAAPITTIADLPSHIGHPVTLRGWLYNLRASGKLLFPIFRDGTGTVQGIVPKAAVPAEVFDTLKTLTLESSVLVTGTPRSDPRAPSGVELDVTGLVVVQRVPDATPFPITLKEHGVDFLMEHRHLWLRTPRQSAILRVRATIMRSAAEYFDTNGFIRTDPPILTPNACEGTSELFEMKYFEDDMAYLTQSGQLYIEATALALGKVYSFGPTFRAEKSKTRRHLTEFWMIEPEVAFLELDGLMDLAEDFLTHILTTVLKHHRADLTLIGRDLTKLEAVLAPVTAPTRSASPASSGSPIESPGASHVASEMWEGGTPSAQQAQAPLLSSRSNAEGSASPTQAFAAGGGPASPASNAVISTEGAAAVERPASPTQATQPAPTPWLSFRSAAEESASPTHTAPAAQSTRRFPRLSYDEAHAMLVDAYARGLIEQPHKEGDDFGSPDETYISSQFDQPVLIHRYPSAIKAFYMQPDPSNPTRALCVDVLAPEGYGEIIGGSQRIDSYDLLKTRIEEAGLPLAPFEWYLDLRRYGSVPHSGFGMGIERAVAWICGLDHVRETIPFPRTLNRIYP